MPWPARIALRALAVLCPLVMAVGSAPPAGAHPFLVRSAPADGARLGVAPRSVSLQFSEALGQEEPQVTVSRPGQGAPERLPMATDGARLALRGDVDIGSGIYTVRWRVVGDDGHLNSGAFSFAIGAVSGSLPRARTGAAPAGLFRSGARWLFFLGLALSAGSVATALLVDCDRRARRGALTAGLTMALGGATTVWAASFNGFGGPVGSSRQQVLLATAASLLSVALPLRRRVPAVGFLLTGAAVAWAGRSQVAVSHGLAGLALDATHLLAAAVWVGALALLAGDLWRARRRPSDLTARSRRYAALVVAPVVVLAVAGAISALLVVPAPADVWRSGYGRLLAIKTVLFATGLALAWRGRRALRSGSSMPLPRPALAEAAVLIGVLGVAAVLGNTAPPPPRVAAASVLGPPPLAGPVVRDAGLAGILTVSVTAGDGRLQIEVVAPGGPARNTEIAVFVGPAPDQKRLSLRPCGAGCLSGPWAPPPGSTTVRVQASAPGWRGGDYVARIDWPPAPEDPALLARVLEMMRAQPAVEVTERTSSGPDSVVVPAVISGTGASIVDEAPYASGQADDVRGLAGKDGLSLFLPGERIWVTMWLDGADRLLRERIVSLNHLIERDYRYPGGS